MHEFRPHQIQIAGRNVQCETPEERALLLQAQSIADDPEKAATFSVGTLHLMRSACQRYSLGKVQRLVKLAIDRVGG